MTGVRMRYWVLITEDELYDWSQCYRWKLPQRPLALDCNQKAVSEAVGKRFASLRENADDNLVVAEFNHEGKPTAAMEIPFFRVDVLCGMSVQRVKILEDRYSAFGLKATLLDEGRTAMSRKALLDATASEERLDIKLGAMAMLEIFQVEPGVDFESVVDDATCAILDKNGSLLSAVFEYSRSEPWHFDGLMAGLCDLGKILRQRLTGDGLKQLQKLSMMVRDCERRGDRSSFALVCSLMSGFDAKQGFDTSLVLLLAWKYAAERKNGQIDVECILNDMSEIGRDCTNTVRRALVLFGSLSGFRAVADVYHCRMRESR